MSKSRIAAITDKYKRLAAGGKLPGWVREVLEQLPKYNPKFKLHLDQGPWSDPYNNLVMYGDYEQGLGIQLVRQGKRGPDGQRLMRAQFVNPNLKNGAPLFYFAEGSDVGTDVLARNIIWNIKKAS